MNFDQIKGLLNSVVGTVSEKGKVYADSAAGKTKAAGRIAKLSVDLAGEKESLKKAYAAIGQTYMESRHEGEEGLLAQLCEEAEAVAERIAVMEAELAELKAGFAPAEKADVEVSFEEVVEETEKEAECGCEGEECGCEGEKEAECCCEKKNELQEKVEEVAEKLEAVVDAVVEKVEEAVEEIGKEDK